MKKLIPYFIVLSVLLSMIPFAQAAGDDNSAETFAKGIGLIDDETYNGNEFVKRAEFAGILAQLCGLNEPDADLKEWQNNNLTDMSRDTVNIDLEARRFSDVDVSHPYYSQIMAVSQRGYMIGVSEKLFAPEYNLVLGDAVSVFVNMLGYSEMTKLNSGIATTIGLTSGIITPMNEPAKMGDIIKLIYNALDINVLEINIAGTENVSYSTSEETFMTAVLEMEKVKGVMTDNGYTSFKGESRLADEQVQVGSIIANISEATEYVRDYIGHTVNMYYSTKDDEYEVVYVELAKGDDSITFDIADFESFENNEITYFNGNRSVRKALSNTIYMIYNGEAKTVFDESIFNFESGKVTLASTSGGNYDLIIVTCYEFAVVSSASVNSELIYNKIKNPDKPELNEIDCSADGAYKKVTIKDTAGNIISLSDLAQNDVLNIVRNSKNITIIVSKTNVEGFNVKGILTDEKDKRMITNGEVTYTVSDAYENYQEKVQFMLGNTYAIYLNMFDRIVWAEKFAGGDNIGILTKVYNGEDENLEELRFVKIFTSGGKLERIRVAEKIKYNDANKKFENIVVELENYYGEAIMYTMDENGIITKITTPEAFGTFGDRGWHEIAPEGSYQFHTNDKDLSQMMFYIPGTTTVFAVPKNASDYDDEKAFSANKYAFSDNGYVTAKGYSRDKYDVIADVIIIKTAGAGVGAIGGSDIFVIDKMYQGINADDEVIDVMDGWLIDISEATMSYTSLSVSSECIMIDQKQGNEIDPNGNVKYTGPRTFSELERGDIIRYSRNSDNEVYKIRIAYDSSTGSYFNSGAGGYGSDLPLYPGQEAASTGASTWAGYALTKSGTGVRITRGVDTLPSSINLSDVETIKNSLYAFKVNRPNVILVVEKDDNGKISMYKGSIDDLRTYQETQRNGDTDVLVMLTEWSSATRGTVIYKNFDFKQ